MLQLFHMDVAKVDLGCFICCKCFRDMLQKFVQNILSIPDVCCKRFDLDVSYVLYICCNRMFQMFHLFQSSVAASVFMLQVASVLSVSCICLHTYVVSVCIRCFIYLCCIQVFRVARVSCCSESQGARGSGGGTTWALGNGVR